MEGSASARRPAVATSFESDPRTVGSLLTMQTVLSAMEASDLPWRGKGKALARARTMSAWNNDRLHGVSFGNQSAYDFSQQVEQELFGQLPSLRT